jgi:flagellar biosynthesis protein FliR
MIRFPEGFDALLPMGVLFLLVAARIGGLFLIAPIFSSQSISAKVRLTLVMVISFAVMLSLSSMTPPSLDMLSLIVALIGEVAVGAAAGLSAAIVLAAVETAGQLLGIPMGLGFSGAVDPMSGGNRVVTTRFLSLIATMVVLVLNVHHMLLELVAESFEVLPPGYAVPTMLASRLLLKDAAFIFDGAVRLAAPVMIVLLGVMATVGLLARVAQKLNLLVLSFAISVGLGLITLRAVLPDMVAWIRGVVMRIEPLTLQVLDGFIRG